VIALETLWHVNILLNASTWDLKTLRFGVAKRQSKGSDIEKVHEKSIRGAARHVEAET
jgi:hypothetical protein